MKNFSELRNKKLQFVRDLNEGDQVGSSFLVRHSQLATGKTGKPYLSAVLMDRSGEIDARAWDKVANFASHIVPDAFVWVKGKVQNFQGRKQVIIDSVEVLREDDLKTEDFLEPGTVDVGAQFAALDKLIDSMENEHYKALAQAVMIEDEDVRKCLERAPAAKSVHHAYPAGLLEHIVSVSTILSFMGRHYQPHVDRDLLLLGGFFHDIAKIWELSYSKTTDYTDEGRLVGHLVMGVELVERKIQEIDRSGKLSSPFPNEKRLLVKHVILSHHGRLEYGSPKRPKCVEAMIIHSVDDLDSKANQILKFLETDLNAGKWTGLHRQLERYFYKPEWARTDLN